MQLAILLFLLLAYSAQFRPFSTWGFQPHKLINRYAIFTLPPGMISFYKYHINYLSEQAVAPDHRRYALPEEGARHFIDLDFYGADVPRNWDALVDKFPMDSIQEHGILPWHLMVVKSRLVEAFQHRNKEQILRISAEAGHYLADAHVPLHTTSNYNGQYTNQLGIHGFWETRVPELLGPQFDLWVGKATYRNQWYKSFWDIVMHSHQAVDSVLQYEKTLSVLFEEDRKYSYEVRLNHVIRVYSSEFSKAYHHVLNRQIEKRLRASIKAVGDFWYSCWLEAGQPDLSVKSKVEKSYKSEYQYVADSIWRRPHLMRKP